MRRGLVALGIGVVILVGLLLSPAFAQTTTTAAGGTATTTTSAVGATTSTTSASLPVTGGSALLSALGFGTLGAAGLTAAIAAWIRRR